MATAATETASAEAAQARKKGLTRFEWGCVAVVVVAFLLRLDFFFMPAFIWDTAWYLMLSRSFAETGTFLVRWSDPPMFSGYWPPLYIVYVTPFVKVFGAKYATLVLAAVTATFLLTLAVFLTTWDLFGRTRAFAAAALIAASPAFYSSDASGMSESLLALMVTLTVWAFVRSLDKPVFLPVSALFGILAYLGKASLGLPFVAVGIVLVAAWRVKSRGLQRVLRSPMDIGLAVAGVAFMLFLAFTRTERVGSIGLGVIEPVRRAVTEPMWAPVFLFKVFFAAAFLLVITLPLSLRIGDALRAKRTEGSGAIWIAAIFPLLVGPVFTTSFYFTEARQIVDFDNIRYLTPAIVPFLWVLLPFWDPHARPTVPEAEGQRLRRRHEMWFVLAVGTMFVLLLLHPNAGNESLGRLLTFLLLALVPLGFALAARASHVDLQARKGLKGTVSYRYFTAPAPITGRTTTLVLVAVGAVLAWYVSSWYLSVAVGLAVALAIASPRAQVVAMALVLLAATTPTMHTPLPAEAAADEGLARLPEGTLVGMSEPIVYSAAVAPDHLRLRLIDPSTPIQPDVDAILVSTGYEHGPYPGFVEVGAWDYTFTFSATLWLRLAFEQHVLGEKVEFQALRGLTLFVREDLASHFPAPAPEA